MTHALRIRLRKSFGEQQVLDGVGFDVPKEPSSACSAQRRGKSTLIRSIMGIVEPDGGTIELDGTPWSREAVRRIGYLPEERLYRDMKVGEQAVYFARLKGRPGRGHHCAQGVVRAA